MTPHRAALTNNTRGPADSPASRYPGCSPADLFDPVWNNSVAKLWLPRNSVKSSLTAPWSSALQRCRTRIYAVLSGPFSTPGRGPGAPIHPTPVSLQIAETRSNVPTPRVHYPTVCRKFTRVCRKFTSAPRLCCSPTAASRPNECSLGHARLSAPQPCCPHQTRFPHSTHNRIVLSATQYDQRRTRLLLLPAERRRA
jgi:hypothetical protein